VRLTVRVLGLTLLDLEVSDTDDDVEDLTAPPRTFGFHGSGTGQIDLDTKEDRSLDSIEPYSRRR
jgi:hypothetical protein